MGRIPMNAMKKEDIKTFGPPRTHNLPPIDERVPKVEEVEEKSQPKKVKRMVT